MKNYVLIDRSGSMESRWVEVIAAIGAYAGELKGKTKLQVSVFDAQIGSMDYVEVFSGKAKHWTAAKLTDIRPRGMTPLRDAVGRLWTYIAEAKPKKAQILIITDGHENASALYNEAAVQKIMADWKQAGYDVVFIGTDFKDVYKSGGNIGVAAINTVNMTQDNYATGMASVATRSKGIDAGTVFNVDALSAETRAAAGEDA